MDNSITPQPRSHAHLYIVVGLLVVFALFFFAFKIPTDVELPVDSTPLGLKRIVLTAEQMAAREAALADPLKDQKITLSKEQQSSRQTQLQNNKGNETYTLTPEQQRAREELLKQIN